MTETICVKCKNFNKDDQTFLYSRCAAKPHKDFVTGKLDYDFARIKNDKGQCPDYVELKNGQA